MNRTAVAAVVVSLLGLTACSGASSSSGEPSGAAASEVVLDVRCATDADCPGGFECEAEVEHGVDTSYCVSHDEDAAAAGECPAGYELEEEHGGTFCKPHGGDDDDGHDGSGSDDDEDHSGPGRGDGAGDDDGGEGDSDDGGDDGGGDDDGGDDDGGDDGGGDDGGGGEDQG